MTLIKAKLTTELSSAFTSMEPTIKIALLGHFANPLPPHTVLGVDDDNPNKGLRSGGILENNTKSIYAIQEAIDKWSVENAPDNLDTVSKRVKFKDELWTEVAKEWAESLSTHISKDITATMSIQLAPMLATIIDDYIKSASLSVIIPPLTLTIGAGPLAIPNPMPIELLITPAPLPSIIENALLTVPAFGGIK